MHLSIIIDIIRYLVYNNKQSEDIKMGREAILMPKTEEILKQMGQQIKLARLRRHISVNLVAERAGISRATVWAVEKGSPSVAIGYYAVVLHALGNMDADLLLVAKDDKLGRTLQDLELLGSNKNE